jgi:hypothetical protein
MKKGLLIIGFCLVAMGAKAQKSYDYGLFLGMTQSHRYSILPVPDFNGLDYAAGGYYRYSLNARYSLRGGVNLGFDHTNFMPNMVDAFGFFEFNFHPLSPKRDKKKVTSYISVGLSYLDSIPMAPKIRNIRVPFNVGVRWNATPSLTLGIEWALRKGYEKDFTLPEPRYNPLLANWKSHVGVTIGYMVSNYCKTCPFYDNERKKLK